jgi:hypothetical protein
MNRARHYPINSARFMQSYSKLCFGRDLIDLIYPELSSDVVNENLGKLKKDIAMKVFRIMQSGGKI